ncbi:sulfurtransferase TusA family protein [Microvirga sp. BT291]|nr:sulfurtransferase TusA family protein [Microvirga pudoricolor]
MTELDLTGLKCPLPVLKTRKALRGLRPGERLRVICTDPLAAIDIPHMVQELRDRLVEQHADGPKLSFVIERHQATEKGPDDAGPWTLKNA